PPRQPTPSALPAAPETAAAPAVAPAPPASSSAPARGDAPTAPADKQKNKPNNMSVYRMKDPDGNEVVIIDGKLPGLTPEAKEQLDKAKEQIEKAMEQFKNGDFARQMADMQREMAQIKFKDTFDSREF